MQCPDRPEAQCSEAGGLPYVHGRARKWPSLRRPSLLPVLPVLDEVIGEGGVATKVLVQLPRPADRIRPALPLDQEERLRCRACTAPGLA